MASCGHWVKVDMDRYVPIRAHIEADHVPKPDNHTRHQFHSIMIIALDWRCFKTFQDTFSIAMATMS